MNIAERIVDFVFSHCDPGPPAADRTYFIKTISLMLQREGVDVADAKRTQLASCGHDPMCCGYGRGG